MSAKWDTSCLDWEDRLRNGHSLVPDLPLFTSEAERGLRIFKRLRVPDMAGMPRLGEVCDTWFFDIVSALFGSLDPETHERMIKEFFLLIPKKNGKSSYSGPLMLTAAIVNERPEAEFVFIAPTIGIANIAFKQAMGTVKADPAIDNLFQCRSHIRTIQHRTNGTTLQIKAADTDVITGGKQVATMVDESHETLSKRDSEAIMLEIRGAMTARREGFVFQTTTQSKAPPQGSFKQELEIARDVRDGKIQKAMLPILYEFPENMVKNDDWKNSAFWHYVNPNLGRSVDKTFLLEQFEDAKRKGVQTMAMFASQHLNVQVGIGLRTDRWSGADFWERQQDDNITKESMIENCEVIIAFIDGGGNDDLLGFGLIGRRKDIPNRWDVWTHSWCNEIVLDIRKSIASELRQFERDGNLTIIGEEMDDIAQMVLIIDEVNQAGKLSSVAVDPYGLGEVVDLLAEVGITVDSDGPKLVGIAQGVGLMSAIKAAERRLAGRTLYHSKDSCMTWCVSNLKIEPTATAIRGTKANAGDAKIDTVMAMFNGVMMMTKNPQVAEAPKYDMFFVG